MVAADTAAVAVAAVEDTVAGMAPLRIADTARRTTIPMGMPYGLCALTAPSLSNFFLNFNEQTC